MRLMLHEVRSGIASRLILIGIEGAPAPELARISRAMAGSLARSGLFSFVENGTANLAHSAEGRFLFRHRYALSPATTAEAFTPGALSRDFAGLLRGLQSSAAPLVEQFGFADPTGAFPALIALWAGPSRIRAQDGVWFAPRRDRALIIADSRAGGMEIAAERKTVQAVDAALRAARPGTARLIASGSAILADAVASRLRGDIALISILSTLLVVGMLFWRFGSLLVVAVIAVPILLSIAAAMASVAAIFGSVQGAAFGFGITMLGVSVDYPVLLIGHRKRGEAPAGTLKRIGRAFTLAVLTALIGLTGMVFSGFPGLAQLGLFAVVGIAVAAASTRFLLPRLIAAADLAPVWAGDPARLLRIERLRAWRGLGLAVVLAALGYLVLLGGPRWQRELESLSPVPPALLAQDAALRAEIGAPDPGQIGLVAGPSAEAVLRREERLLPLLDRLRAAGVISDAEIAARLLPSAGTQRARQALLPPPSLLARRIAEAARGLDFRADAFQPFLADVAAARGMAPVLPADVTPPLLAARIQPLLVADRGQWFGLIAPSGVRDPARLAAALRAAGADYIDVGASMNAILADYTGTAWRWLGAGAAAALLALAVGLRDAARLLKVAGAIAAALVVTVALLTAFGMRLSLINLVSLQFVAGVGLDYALFFARAQRDAEERARTLRTLLTCNTMTVLSFGLLALCRTPLLNQIGLTVAIGAFAALAFAFLFAGPRPGAAEAAA